LRVRGRLSCRVSALLEYVDEVPVVVPDSRRDGAVPEIELVPDDRDVEVPQGLSSPGQILDSEHEGLVADRPDMSGRIGGQLGQPQTVGGLEQLESEAGTLQERNLGADRAEPRSFQQPQPEDS